VEWKSHPVLFCSITLALKQMSNNKNNNINNNNNEGTALPGRWKNRRDIFIGWGNENNKVIQAGPVDCLPSFRQMCSTSTSLFLVEIISSVGV